MPVPSISAAYKCRFGLAGSPFILGADDPRLRVAACPGAPSCARGTTPVRDDAAILAAELSGMPGAGIILHVSGCARGCAHPKPAAVTLVGQNGRYDLVLGSAASGSSAMRKLTLGQAAEQVRRVLGSQPEGCAA